jgi:hypothetical protein
MIKNEVGSCRHRAFLGYIICKSACLETRYVLSVVHAWIECLIEDRWRYIDLGGTPLKYNIPDDSAKGEPCIIKFCDSGCGDFPNCIRSGKAMPGEPCPLRYRDRKGPHPIKVGEEQGGGD